MNNIHLSILGSNRFSSILNELEFNNILNLSSQSNHNNKNILVKILFVEDLKVKEVKHYLLKNEPIILFLNHKDYVKKNNLSLLDFHVILDLPIEILSFKEILNILIIKYNFFKKSKIIIKDYEIDSNERSITKQKVKIEDFGVGDRVVINRRCGTKYLIGEMATVTDIRRTKIKISFDSPKGRFARTNSMGEVYSAEVVVPLEIVDKM